MKTVSYFLVLWGSFMTTQTPSITIYIHGSQNATKLLSKDIWYCQKGLHHINELPDSSLFLKDAQLLQQADSNRFNLEQYYTFGWSGKVNFNVRRDAGNKLYHELKELLQSYYQKYKTYPVVRIITHSHGGNVALCMVEQLPFFEEQAIELELILLACPVQKMTEYLIKSPLITRSYVLYSTFDLIQKLDWYTYEGKRYLPNRTFQATAPHCSQILVKVNGKRLTHTDFCHSMVRHIPEILKAVDRTEEQGLCLTTYNIQDPEFVCYNGFNVVQSMRATRKKS